jgi:NADH-quinone oxidoreductase subunit A
MAALPRAGLPLWRRNTVGVNLRKPCVATTGAGAAQAGWASAVARGGHSKSSGPDMQPVLYGYLPVLVFMVIAGAIALAMVGGSLLAARQKPYPEKVSAYECGFEPFDDARRRFDVRFYLVAILFIIFDLEVAFLFPWAVSLKDIGWFGFLSMLAFLAVLTVGFVYEWCKGALDWE